LQNGCLSVAMHYLQGIAPGEGGHAGLAEKQNMRRIIFVPPGVKIKRIVEKPGANQQSASRCQCREDALHFSIECGKMFDHLAHDNQIKALYLRPMMAENRIEAGAGNSTLLQDCLQHTFGTGTEIQHQRRRNRCIALDLIGDAAQIPDIITILQRIIMQAIALFRRCRRQMPCRRHENCRTYLTTVIRPLLVERKSAGMPGTDRTAALIGISRHGNHVFWFACPYRSTITPTAQWRPRRQPFVFTENHDSRGSERRLRLIRG